MNIWANTVLTDKGRALLAKLTQGNTLNITSAVTGAGFVTPGFLAKQTEVTDPKQTLEIRPASYPETGTCALTVALRNEGLTVGYEATQVGIHATDPDEGEILFFISQATAAGSGTTIPSETEIASYSAEWTFYFKYGQADSVNVTVDPAGAVSREEAEQIAHASCVELLEYIEQHVVPKEYVHPETHPASMITGLARVATSGKFSDLNGIPAAHENPYMRLVEGGLTKMPAKKDWSSVAYGDGKFVAVAGPYSTDAAYSTDGVTWIPSILPASKTWTSVAYGDGKFVAVTNGGKYAAFSTDGVNWTPFTLPASADWSAITYGGGKFVAVASNGTEASYSDDGINWYPSSLPASARWNAITYGDGKFVAVAYGSTDAAYSTDGITWYPTTLEGSVDWYAVAYGGGKFVAVANGRPYAAYSTDGITWHPSTLPASARWTSVVYGDGKFIAVAGNSPDAAYSTDGITWHPSTLPASAEWRTITYGDGKFVVVAGYTADEVAYSTDGVTWATGIVQNGFDVGKEVLNTIGAAPAYTYGTEDLEAGVSDLKTGTLYFVYE